MRLLVVEDDPTIRMLLARMLRDLPHRPEVLAVGTLAAGLAACARARPDLAFVDLGLPDGSGLTLLEDIQATQPGMRRLVLSVLNDAGKVLAAIRTGASGYVLKDDLPDDLGRFIERVMAGEVFLSPAIAGHIIRDVQAKPSAQGMVPVETLTPRETQVLQLIAKGYRNGQVAEQLGLSPHTIASFVKSIYRKLEVNSRGGAVFKATRGQLIAP
jgi:DNA-binding NarL/FixJ family response regulator